MPYYPFPNYLVESFNQATYEEEFVRIGWERYRYETQQHLFELGVFFQSEQEQEAHNFLLESLAKLDNDYQNLQPGLESLLEMAKTTAKFVQHFGKFCEQRQKPKFLKIRELDLLLSASIATIQGRGGRGAVSMYCEPSYQKVGDLSRCLEDIQSDLPGEVTRALANGFTACSAAFELLAKWLSDEDDQMSLERACTDLKNGGELLEYLQDWQLEASHANGFQFPVAGAEISRLLSQGKTEEFRAKALPKLRDYWDGASTLIILPDDQTHLLLAIDELMERLTTETDDLMQICGQLEGHFQEVEKAALPLGQGDGSWDRLGQFLAATLGGGVPDLLAIDTAMSLRESPSPELQQVAELMGTDVDLDAYAEALRYILTTKPSAELS